jgi:hypothetical protein
VVITSKEDRESQIDDATLTRIEREHPAGLSSAEILDIFATHSVPLSEATLRKYVQHGLLPRSVRVGRKGKHQGSQGLYPVSVVRQIVRIKRMMANNLTLEQLKRDVFFMRSDLQQLETTLGNIFSTLSGVMKARKADAYTRSVGRDVDEAKALGRDLIARLALVEARLADAPELRRASAG